MMGEAVGFTMAMFFLLFDMYICECVVFEMAVVLKSAYIIAHKVHGKSLLARNSSNPILMGLFIYLQTMQFIKIIYLYTYMLFPTSAFLYTKISPMG